MQEFGGSIVNSVTVHRLPPGDVFGHEDVAVLRYGKLACRDLIQRFTVLTQGIAATMTKQLASFLSRGRR